MIYRPEIDGLRALAVIPVILFHAKLGPFPGGYAGVDVFFVISGYLITSIILNDYRTGNFSFSRFYERRAKRILPGLYSIIIFTTAIAALIFLPKDLINLSKSQIFAQLFSSNIFFWKSSGYFDVSSELKPLLHTWSLSVEEQYYILFPLFLVILLRKVPKHITAVFLVGFSISLALAQWGSYNKPLATYYLLPTRVWEILVGAIIASASLPAFKIHSLNQAASLVGLFFIAVAVILFDENTPFPSIYALIPTVGTALIIIFATENTFTHKLLSNIVLVRVGILSYSAYLWHQPLLALARYQTVFHLSVAQKIGIILLTFAFSTLSYKALEKPLRNSSNKVFFSATFACVLISILSAAAILQTDGLINRSTPNNMAIDAYKLLGQSGRTPEIDTKGNKCESEAASICRLIPTTEDTKSHIFIIGDSHSGDIIDPIYLYGIRQGRVAISQMSVPSCGFIPAHASWNNGECGEAPNKALEFIKRNDVDKVIFSTNLFGHFTLLEGYEFETNKNFLLAFAQRQ